MRIYFQLFWKNIYIYFQVYYLCSMEYIFVLLSCQLLLIIYIRLFICLNFITDRKKARETHWRGVHSTHRLEGVVRTYLDLIFADFNLVWVCFLARGTLNCSFLLFCQLYFARLFVNLVDLLASCFCYNYILF